MNGFQETAAVVLGWLLQTSVQAGLLIVIVAVLLALVGRRLAPRWHCLLWLVVLVRMVLPWAPAGRLSVHNVVEPLAALGPRIATEPSRPTTVIYPAAPADGDDAGLADSAAEAADAEQPDNPAVMGPAVETNRGWWPGPWVWPAVWLAGAAILGIYVLWSNFALWRAVKGGRPVTDGAILDLLEACKAKLGITTRLSIIPTDRLPTPALYGVVRPRLLVPAALMGELSREELRHVLLHELAHLKRWDVHLNWLSALLQVLHWFNPLVWLAFARMRPARELACDQEVLGVLGDDDVPFAYGLIERADLKWYKLRTPSIEVPAKFTIALAFNTSKTKGIYFHYHKNPPKSRSLAGTVDSGFKPKADREWMMRVHVESAKPSDADTRPAAVAR